MHVPREAVWTLRIGRTVWSCDLARVTDGWEARIIRADHPFASRQFSVKADAIAWTAEMHDLLYRAADAEATSA